MRALTRQHTQPDAYNISFELFGWRQLKRYLPLGAHARRVDEVYTNVSSKIARKNPGCFGPRWAVTQYENGYLGRELDQMMEYPGAARQLSRGASCFSADERVEGSKSRGGPEQWPEWKQEDDQAYRQWLDNVFEPDVD
jgi:hypothetical protein